MRPSPPRFSRAVVTGLFAASLFAGCGDKDDDTAGSTDGSDGADGGADGASDGTDGGTDGSDGSSDGADGTSPDAAFVATGTYDGEPFAVDCNFDDTDPAYTAGLQCQDDIQFFVWCRPDPDHATIAGLPPDQFQVTLNLHTAIATTGSHDLVGVAGVCVGDTLATPLCTTSENIESGTMSFDAVSLWTAATGSFVAEWNDSGDTWAGDHTATVSGSFDFSCP